MPRLPARRAATRVRNSRSLLSRCAGSAGAKSLCLGQSGGRERSSRRWRRDSSCGAVGPTACRSPPRRRIQFRQPTRRATRQRQICAISSGCDPRWRSRFWMPACRPKGHRSTTGRNAPPTRPRMRPASSSCGRRRWVLIGAYTVRTISALYWECAEVDHREPVAIDRFLRALKTARGVRQDASTADRRRRVWIIDPPEPQRIPKAQAAVAAKIVARTPHLHPQSPAAPCPGAGLFLAATPARDGARRAPPRAGAQAARVSQRAMGGLRPARSSEF